MVCFELLTTALLQSHDFISRHKRLTGIVKKCFNKLTKYFKKTIKEHYRTVLERKRVFKVFN